MFLNTKGAIVPTQHKISKTIMINGGNVASNNSCVNTLLGNVNGLQAFQASMIITQETMYPKQSHHAEIPQHLQNITPTIIIIPICSSKLLKPFLLVLENLNDHGLLHQSLQKVKHTIHIPGLQQKQLTQFRVILDIKVPQIRNECDDFYLIKLSEKGNLLLSLVLHLSSVLAKALELVHELVDHVPEPLVGQLHINDAVEDDLEETTVIVPRVDSLLQRRRQPGV